MSDINETFNDYILEFKKLTTIEKREEILNSIKELIVIFEQMAKMDNISLSYLKSQEILDIKKSNTEDDYLEALLVYLENAKNLIGQYLDKKI